MNIRPLTKEDYPAIDAYIKKRPWERTNKKWAGLIDPTLIETTLKNMNPNIHAVIVENTYLVLFAVISPWFTNKTLIDEIIAKDGYYEGDPRVALIVEYTNANGAQAWGVTWSNETHERQLRYLDPTQFVQAPRVVWSAK